MTHALRCVIRLTLTVVLVAGCRRGLPPEQQTMARVLPVPIDSSSFVTRLGDDTLVVERFVVEPRRLEADVVMRIPRTSHSRYVIELEPAGGIGRMQAFSIAPGGAITPRQTIERAGDSLRVTMWTDGEARTRMVDAHFRTLPFIDMVHWPYELALRNFRAEGGQGVTQPLLTGSRTSPFDIRVLGADSMTITHPSRGTMRVRVDARGRLLGLDAGETTRKLIVTRHGWTAVDPMVVASGWRALDAAGRGLGALSGRGGDTVTVAGATIGLDYGTPAKRGREIWGGLVRFGEVWRTGANRATHFSTDRELVLDPTGAKVVVPPGSYTLFSIPQPDGGTLIVSRETGQAGTAYDPSKDLGRARMAVRPLAEPVEVFRIVATETGPAAGDLRLQWDAHEMVVPFTVREP